MNLGRMCSDLNVLESARLVPFFSSRCSSGISTISCCVQLSCPLLLHSRTGRELKRFDITGQFLHSISSIKTKDAMRDKKRTVRHGRRSGDLRHAFGRSAGVLIHWSFLPDMLSAHHPCSDFLFSPLRSPLSACYYFLSWFISCSFCLWFLFFWPLFIFFFGFAHVFRNFRVVAPLIWSRFCHHFWRLLLQEGRSGRKWWRNWFFPV